MNLRAHLPIGDWQFLPTPRVAPLERQESTPFQKLLFKVTRRAAGAQDDLHVMTVFARLGTIFPPYLVFLSQLLMKGRIPRADKERIILRVAWRVGCPYEWVHHVHMAKEVHVSDAEIASITEEASDAWSARTRTFMRATDALIAHQRIPNEVWARLQEHLTENQAVEFCMLVGHYIMVAMTINTLGIEAEGEFVERLAHAGP